MARKIKHVDDIPVDPVEAVKRGFIWRGLLPRKYKRNSRFDGNDEPKSNPKIERPEPKNSSKADTKKSKDVSEKPDEMEPDEIHEKLIDVTEKAHDILFTADTIFPFTLFPDTITLDREKLTVIQRFFFRVAKVITVPVTSMISADANVGPFFGSVHMTSKYFIDNTHHVNFLRRNDAEEFHRMLQGFIIANEKEIDVSEIDKEDLKILLHDLGHGTNE
jgi:hypothetical protein